MRKGLKETTTNIADVKTEICMGTSLSLSLGRNCIANESDDLRLQFENEYGGDEAKFYKYWPQGFRWTCCGTDAGMAYGCDHHGTGSRPCTCDFCRFVGLYSYCAFFVAYIGGQDGKAGTASHIQRG